MPPATARADGAWAGLHQVRPGILSTRPDVVGEDLAAQLRVLQDKLPPFPADAMAKQSMADELGQPVDELFDEFSDSIAAASIAQVHKARLKDTGEYVAVKVLRPPH